MKLATMPSNLLTLHFGLRPYPSDLVPSALPPDVKHTHVGTPSERQRYKLKPISIIENNLVVLLIGAKPA